jgi:N utilization substance protein B
VARSGNKPTGRGAGGRKREDAGPRRLAREAALQVLYALDDQPADQNDATIARAISAYWSHLEGPASGRPYADDLVRAVMAKRDSIDASIREANSAWRIERMGRVDRNILRIAVYEFGHSDIPPSVSIDEAVELAKRFGGEESPAFVNGTLDKIAKSLGKI